MDTLWKKLKKRIKSGTRILADLVGPRPVSQNPRLDYEHMCELTVKTISVLQLFLVWLVDQLNGSTTSTYLFHIG